MNVVLVSRTACAPPSIDKMGVDPLSPIAPARLRALLLPIGRIKRSRFLSFAARLQAENVVRLGDISPDARPNRSMSCSCAGNSLGHYWHALTTCFPRYVLTTGIPHRHDPLRPILFGPPNIAPRIVSIRHIQRTTGDYHNS